MYLRRTTKLKSEVSLDEPLNVDWDGNELLLSDILGTENDVVYHRLEDEVNRTLLYGAMKKLEPREKELMEMRFGLKSGKEMTQKEVADKLGISQSYSITPGEANNFKTSKGNKKAGMKAKST